MKITQDLVDRTQNLLRDFEHLLDHDPEVTGELRVKLAKAELCLFKIAELMQDTVDIERAKQKAIKQASIELMLERNVG